MGGAHLDDLGGQLRRPVLQVMAVDGQHPVVAAQPAVLGCQPPFQQVKDEDARFVGSAHEFDAELLSRVPLVQHHREDLLPGRAALGVAVRTAAEAPLSKHGELQRATGLRQHGPGIVVRHAADVVVVDLERKHQDDSYFPKLWKCLTFLKETNLVENIHGHYLQRTLYKDILKDRLPKINLK